MKKLLGLAVFLSFNTYACYPEIGKYDLTVRIGENVYHDRLEVTGCEGENPARRTLQGFFAVGSMPQQVASGKYDIEYWAPLARAKFITTVKENNKTFVIEIFLNDEKYMGFGSNLTSGYINKIDGASIGIIESMKKVEY